MVTLIGRGRSTPMIGLAPFLLWRTTIRTSKWLKMGRMEPISPKKCPLRRWTSRKRTILSSGSIFELNKTVLLASGAMTSLASLDILSKESRESKHSVWCQKTSRILKDQDRVCLTTTIHTSWVFWINLMIGAPTCRLLRTPVNGFKQELDAPQIDTINSNYPILRESGASGTELLHKNSLNWSTTPKKARWIRNISRP